MPEILEVTFHRRDRIRDKTRVLHVPTDLDCECVPNRPELHFYAQWLEFTGLSAADEA
jgi:hypothetical protein